MFPWVRTQTATSKMPFSLVDDLRCRQNRRLADGGNPHSKLPRLKLLDLKPTTGDFWNRPDIAAEQHAVAAKHWLKRAPLGFRREVATRGRAGSRATFATLAARAKQQWLFVVITPLEHDVYPHFKPPAAQGWALGRYVNSVN